MILLFICSLYYFFQKFFDLDEFLNDLCQHVSTSKRKNALKEFVEFCNSEYRKIIRHSNVRWLSIGRCVQRILQIYEPLKAYIISDEGEKLEQNTRMILDILTPANTFNNITQILYGMSAVLY